MSGFFSEMFPYPGMVIIPYPKWYGNQNFGYGIGMVMPPDSACNESTKKLSEKISSRALVRAKW